MRKSCCARAVRERVAFVPGRAFFADGAVTNMLRLSYSLASPERIEMGLWRLGRLIDAPRLCAASGGGR